MYGLKKIFFRNSIFEGLDCWIPAYGHVNLSAGNGAGKTSTLFLIPAFYGKTHADLVSKHADNKSFKDYYLPYLNSYIAFYYTREDGDRLAVMYKSGSDNEIRYRFIVGTIEETLHSNQIKDMLENERTTEETLQEIEKMGFEVSRGIKHVIDYRSIIQNDHRALNRNGKPSAVDRRLASRFGFGGHDSQMSHLQELTYASITRQGIFGRLHAMICDSMFGNLSIDSKPAYMNNNQIVSDIRSLKDFAKNEDSFNICIQDAIEYTDTSFRLDCIGKGIKNLLPLETKRLKHLDEQIEAYTKDSNDFVSHFENQLTELTRQHIESKSSCQDLEQKLTRIYKEREIWDKKSPETKQAKLDNLGLYREDAQAKEEHYNNLLNEVAKEQSNKDREVNKEDKRLLEQTKKINKSITHLSEKKDKINTDLDSDTKLLNDEKESALSDYNEETNRRNISERDKISELKNKATNSIKTIDEELALTEAEEHRDRQRTVVDKHQGNVDVLLQEERKVISTRDESLKDLNAFNTLMDKVAREVEEIKRQLYPKEGTLLAALKASKTNWETTIGKVINPDFFDSKDLHPFFEDEGDTIFGWKLELDHILVPELCKGNEYLEGLLEVAEGELRRASENCKQAENIARKHNNEFDDVRKRLNAGKARLASEKNLLRETEISFKRIREDINNAISERKLQASKDLKSAKSTLDNYILNRKNGRAELKIRHADKLNERNAKAAIDICNIEEKIDIQRSDIERLETESKQRIVEIENAFQLLCEKKGIDNEVIATAKKSRDESRAKVEKVDGYRDLLEEYRQWLKDNWDTVDTVQTNLVKQKEITSDLEGKKDQLSKEGKEKRAEFIRLISTENSKRKELNQSLEHAETQLRRIGEISQRADAHEGDLTALVETAVNLYTQRESMKINVIKRFDQITRVMNDHPESQVYKAWRTALNFAENDSVYDSSTPEFKIYMAGKLENFHNEQLLHTKKALAEQFRGAADSLQKYYENLAMVNRRVKNISDELYNKIQQTSTIPDIRNVRCNLLSKVEIDSSWGALKAFTKEWDSWESTRGIDDLPSDLLVQKLIQAIDNLNASKIDSNIRSLVGLSISMEENGTPKTIHSDQDFGAVSSNGLCLIATIILFVGLSRFLCPDKRVGVTLPIDELSSISSENIERLIRMFDQENIHLFSAHPSNDINILQQFNDLVRVDKKSGVDIVDPESLKERSTRAKFYFEKLKAEETES
jgi:hypothetical protein